MVKQGVFIFALIFSLAAQGQKGGQQVYSFLLNGNSPRSNALSGNAILHQEQSSIYGFDNPANLDTLAIQSLGINYASFGAGQKMGNASYTWGVGAMGVAFAGIQFAGYGNMTQTDETGQVTGEFGVNEYALYTGYSMPLSTQWQLGATMKNIIGNYANNRSYGLGVDLGIVFSSKNERTQWAAVAKNAGKQLATYDNLPKYNLPFNPQLGFSHTLDKAPFRLVVIGHTLHQWQVSYDTPLDPNATKTDDFTGEVTERAFTLTKIAKHLIFAVDLVPNEKFFLSIGYDYSKASEMKVGERQGLVGASLSAGLKIKRFQVGYSISSNHFATNTHGFGISTNLNRF